MADGVRIEIDTQRFATHLARFIAVTGVDADQATLAVAAEVLADTVEGWPVAEVAGGYSRGAWWGPEREELASYRIGNPARYAAVIEYGGYPGVGPKTEEFVGTRLAGGFQINAGIFPKQKPAAPLRRALANHYGQLSQRIKAIHQARWGTL